MAVNYLWIDSATDDLVWSTSALPGTGRTHMVLIDDSTDVISWSGIAADPTEGNLTMESTTDVPAWS